MKKITKKKTKKIKKIKPKTFGELLSKEFKWITIKKY